MKTFTSGAKSSEESPRLDLVPLASLLRQAARMALGAATHGERNYEKGAGDPVFIRDRKNHLVLHALRYLEGDQSDDHLGAILANAGMLARLEELTVQARIEEFALPADLVESASQHFDVRRGPYTASITEKEMEHLLKDDRTYDDKRNDAKPCLCGCGKLIQNAERCQASRTTPAGTR